VGKAVGCPPLPATVSQMRFNNPVVRSSPRHTETSVTFASLALARVRSLGRSAFLAATLVSVSVSLQGCALDVPTHIYASWRSEPDYLIDFQFTLPGEYDPFLNSCSMDGLVGGMQCSGRGHCVPWDSSKKNTPLFCKCNHNWGDPECRTRRKPQLTAYALSLGGGIFGLDQFYLGNTGMGIVKLCSLGGFGFLYLKDVVEIGTGNPYTSVTRHSMYPMQAATTTMRLGQDMPHWFFVVTVCVWFYSLGFVLAGLSATRYVRMKRAEFMLLNALESRKPGLTSMTKNQWVEANYPELKPLNSGGRGAPPQFGMVSTMI